MKKSIIYVFNIARNISLVIVLMLLIGLFSAYYLPLEINPVFEQQRVNTKDELDLSPFSNFIANEGRENSKQRNEVKNSFQLELQKSKVLLSLKPKGKLVIDPYKIVMIKIHRDSILLFDNTADSINLATSGGLTARFEELGNYKSMFHRSGNKLINYNHVTKIFTRPIKKHNHNKSSYHISTTIKKEIKVPNLTYKEIKDFFT